MATARDQLKDERLDLRVTAREKDLIREAADAAHQDISTFARDTLLQRAERVLAERRAFFLPPDRWDAFMEVLDRPVPTLSEKPRLAELLGTPSILER
jgi:uncharacterized protein (DUF1778 family)